MGGRTIFSIFTGIMFSFWVGAAGAAPKLDGGPLTRNELHNYVEGATIAVLLHEVGHAVIDIYDLPTVGEAEVNADDFAGIFIAGLAGNDDNAHYIASAVADFYLSYIGQAQTTVDGKVRNFVYWDEHDMGERRAFNVLCDLFAFFPELYEEKLRVFGADYERMQRCISDNQRNKQSWDRLLEERYRSDTEAQMMRDMTFLGMDGDFADSARFRVTYSPSPYERAHGFFQGNERLRYHLLTYVANLLTARFSLDPISKTDTKVGSIDINSRPCGEANAFYRNGVRAIDMCHELQEEMADAYIEYRTGKKSGDWWSSMPLREYHPAQEGLRGVWAAADGTRLTLERGDLLMFHSFTIDRGDDETFAPRHGMWGVDGGAIWLIETWRDGDNCFNPACRPNLSRDGLSVAERAALRIGAIPRGQLTGEFHIPGCSADNTLSDEAAKERKEQLDYLNDLYGVDSESQAGQSPENGGITPDTDNIVVNTGAACDANAQTAHKTITLNGVVYHDRGPKGAAEISKDFLDMVEEEFGRNR